MVAAAEFKQKSRWSKVWPNMHYGAMYLNYSVGRKMPMRGVNWVTRDSNRLTTFENRYASVVADLDVKKNEEDLSIPLADIRWNDHRRIHWLCSFCGSPYRKSVSVRTKFHAGCNRCKGKHSSEVLGAQSSTDGTDGGSGGDSLAERFPKIAAQLTDNGKQVNIAGLSCTSKFRAEWTCQGCAAPYEATIRSRTGAVEPGQAPLHPQVTSWARHCPNCRWRANLAAVGEQALREGQFLGLASPPAGATAAKAIPRRRKLVV